MIAPKCGVLSEYTDSAHTEVEDVIWMSGKRNANSLLYQNWQLDTSVLGSLGKFYLGVSNTHKVSLQA